MPTLILTVLAPICATAHLWARPAPRSRRRRLEIHLLWWLALALGVASVLTGLAHLIDGKATAEDIGFTRGDAGFQVENAMADLAIGVLSLLCLRIRGTFWIAVLMFASIQYYGDAAGHVYQWLHNDNTKPGNVGIPLWLDIIGPTVATGLYALRRAALREESTSRPVAPPAPAVAQGR